MQQIVYLKSPKYRRSGNVLHGNHYTIDWVQGYAGPFFKDNIGFRRMWGKCPAGTTVVTEEEFLQSSAGEAFLQKREERLDEANALRIKALERKANAIDSVKLELAVRRGLRSRFGLLNPPDWFVDMVHTGNDTRLNSGQMPTRMNAWRKVLKWCSTEGDWDSSKYNGKLSEEWAAFNYIVVSKLFDNQGNLLPIADADEVSEEPEPTPEPVVEQIADDSVEKGSLVIPGSSLDIQDLQAVDEFGDL